jgi:hypothetical protein
LAFLTTFHHFTQWLLTAGNQPLRTSITGDSGCNQSQARSQKNEDKRVLLKSSEQSLSSKKRWLQQFRFLGAFCEVPDN